MLIGCASCATLNRVPAERLADGPVCGKCKAALADGKPVPVSDSTFNAAVERTEPGECRVVEQRFQELAVRHAAAAALVAFALGVDQRLVQVEQRTAEVLEGRHAQ